MTKNLKLKLSVTGLVLGIVAFGVILRARRVHSQNPPPCSSAFATLLQQGLDAEAPCPTSLSTISPSISNLSFFTQYRCGITLSSTVQQRLAQLEQEAWPGNCNGVCQLTRQDIKNVITAELLSVSSRLSDSQITNMASQSFQNMPGYTPPQRSSQLYVGTNGPMTDQATFIQSAQQVRSGNSTAVAAATTQISNEVDEICNVLAYALPSDWNVTYYSPYRVFVIAYYVVSDDNLARSYTGCQTMMAHIQD